MSKDKNRIITPGPDMRPEQDQTGSLGLFFSKDGARYYNIFKPSDMMEFATALRDLDPDAQKTELVLCLHNPRANAWIDFKFHIPASKAMPQKGRGVTN